MDLVIHLELLKSRDGTLMANLLVESMIPVLELNRIRVLFSTLLLPYKAYVQVPAR
jgi:hypothetical protein